jgi:hypothetical protein
MLPNSRLVSQMQRIVSDKFYSDAAYLLIDVNTGAYDDYNNPVVSTSEVPISCSFTDTPAMEKWRDFIDIQEIAGEIRFATPRPTKGNRIKITGRFGTTTYTDQTFEIIGIRDRDEFGYVCALKAVVL